MPQSGNLAGHLLPNAEWYIRTGNLWTWYIRCGLHFVRCREHRVPVFVPEFSIWLPEICHGIATI